MPAPSVSPEDQAEIEDLERAIREAVDAEIGELAADLATAADARLFGHDEFTIRDLALKSAAKAVEQHLGRKKGDTGPRITLPAIRRALQRLLSPRARPYCSYCHKCAHLWIKMMEILTA